MQPLVDPRHGDIEDDASSTKSNSLLTMAGCCHDDACKDADPRRGDPAFMRVLWIVLAINAAMFVVEIVAGLAAE